jgi:hypothetical protein
MPYYTDQIMTIRLVHPLLSDVRMLPCACSRDPHMIQNINKINDKSSVNE